MDSNTFLIILYVCIFVIIIGHVWLKGIMGEPIARHKITRDKITKDKITQDKITQDKITKDKITKQKILEYVGEHLEDLNRNKYVFNPKGSNYYNKDHDSDLHNEQTNLSKYFEIEQSVPDTKKLLQQLQCKDEHKDCMNEVRSSLTDNQTGNPLFFDQGSDGTLTYQPDIWKYENERVMNGGSLDGIRPMDNARSDFAVYPAPLGGKSSESNFIQSYPYTVTSGMF